jgi:hypothetical protein
MWNCIHCDDDYCVDCRVNHLRAVEAPPDEPEEPKVVISEPLPTKIRRKQSAILRQDTSQSK